MKTYPPCKGCTERTPGCACDAYKEWKAEFHRQKAWLNKGKEAANFMIESVMRSNADIQKKKKSRRQRK